MGVVIFLLGLAIVVGIVLYKNPELKVKVGVVVGSIIAALGAYFDKIMGLWQ